MKKTKREEITRISQITINNLCDYTRKTIINKSDNLIRDGNAIDYIAATKTNTYLFIKIKNWLNVYIFH
jgi:hypothetical protein